MWPLNFHSALGWSGSPRIPAAPQGPPGKPSEHWRIQWDLMGRGVHGIPPPYTQPLPKISIAKWTEPSPRSLLQFKIQLYHNDMIISWWYHDIMMITWISSQNQSKSIKINGNQRKFKLFFWSGDHGVPRERPGGTRWGALEFFFGFFNEKSEKWKKNNVHFV